jgi:heterodisulfide reductase subunit C2
MNPSTQKTVSEDIGHVLQRAAGEVRDMVKSCIQCGTCTASCPNAAEMDMTPRQLWRLVLMERTDDIFSSRTFQLCSDCYTCTLRCPRGLPLTDAMNRLKQAAAAAQLPSCRRSDRFYRSFLDVARRRGRLREMEFMSRYFLAMKNPFLPLQFTPLGIQLLRKGKLSIQLPMPGGDRLQAIFQKVSSLEEP